MAKEEFQVEELIENRYRVLDVIGAGGMGTLYRVSDEAHHDGAQTGKIVALKTVSLRIAAVGVTESVERFQREFQLLTQLGHPNLVSVYDYGITDKGRLYFTMEWIEGQDLEPGQRPLDPASTVPLMVQVCRALAYLHARGVIHGDLKPQNVLLTSEIGETKNVRRQIKIVDFGVALELRSPELRARYYSPGYSAPEVQGQRRVDHRADLYSLGAMWYALLVGEPPMFMLGMERLIPFTLDEALEKQAQVPLELGQVITRLLATAPAERYASANEVIEALNEITGSAYALETRETAASYALRVHFVNREAEIEALQAAWNEAQESAGKVVLISGESGVGKTRLLVELEVGAELGGGRVVWGQCAERGGEGYHPWREVLRVLVRYIEGADEEAMRQVGPVLAALLPELWERDYMLGLAPAAELDPQAAQLRLNDAIVKVMRAAAELRPTLIVIENVHWADEATLELLRYLVRVPGAVGLLTCITYRDDEVGPEHVLKKLTGERVQRIRLRLLSPQVTTDLARAMLGLEVLPALLTERLQQTTGGNAFFVQELIRALAVEGEVLRRTVEGWQVDGGALQEARLPESIRQVVERRLGQLSVQAREILEWGAVVGLVFWEGSVIEVGQTAHARVRAALAELSDLGLIAERDETFFSGEREYLFFNPIVREASYESILCETRREYHSRVALWLLAHSEGEVSANFGLIAEHLERAGQVEQALIYLQRAGELAAAQFANAEAVAHFSRALDLTLEDDASKQDAERMAERYAILLARESVYDLQGTRETQYQDLAALERLAEDLDDARRAEVALRQAVYAGVIGDYPASIAAAQEAVRLAEAAQDVSKEAAGYDLMGYALWRQGNYKRARLQLERALGLAQGQTQATSLRQVGASCLRSLGIVSWNQGDQAGAREHFEQSLRICHELGDRQGEGSGFNNLGVVFTEQGDCAEAKVYCEQALRISREIGDRQGEGMALSNLSRLFHRLGDDETAREYSRQAFLVGQEIDSRDIRGFSLTYLGQALEGLDRLTEAADAYTQAMALRRELGQHQLAIDALAGLARVALAQEDLAQAQASVEEILRYEEDNTLEGTEEPFRVQLTCYSVLCARHDPRAEAILNTAHCLLQEQAAKIGDEETRRSFLENVPAHREIVEVWEIQQDL